MMKAVNLFLCLILTIGGSSLFAQTGVAGPSDEGSAPAYAATITAEDLRQHLFTLASDEFEGRETGTPGQKMAAEYIAAQFEAMGVPSGAGDDTYFQSIAFTAENWESINLEVGKTGFRHLWDYYSFPSLNSSRETVQYDEIVFLGYGIDDERYSDYEGQDVEGKAILIYPDEPTSLDGVSYLTGSEILSDWSIDIRTKLETAYSHGVAMVFIIDPKVQENIAEQRRFMLSPRFRIGAGENPEERFANSMFISTTVARELMGKRAKKVIKARDAIRQDGEPRSVRLKSKSTVTQEKRVRQILGENVLGYIDGTDTELRDEILVVTAHYDHLGKTGNDIYNGADDNASGTSTVLEVAQAFMLAKEAGVGPRRSVLFMLVSGEEKGLLGSKYYVENPIFPLANTIANINVDMVGRVDEKHAADPNYVYVIGADRLSTELHDINESVNQQYTQLELDYTYNEPSDPNRYYYRSDHYNFAERNIPAIFYFNGTHDDYHMITDTAEKINFEKMAVIGQLVFHTAWELANRDKRIEVDVPQN